MNDKKWIILGLLIFMALFLSPFLYNLVTGAKAEAMPEVVLTDKAKAAKQCVMPTEFMRTEHMQLLDEWRLKVVRSGLRDFTNAEGKSFSMSLSNTCMDCHSNKADFCDRCHNYASVNPYCWDCHIENPQGEKK